MRPQTFGNIRVDAVVEFERWDIPRTDLLPRSTEDEFRRHLDWLGSRHVDPDTGNLLLSMHSFLIRTPHLTILFDTCCGNDKQRVGDAPPKPHMLKTPYLENLAKLGVAPEDVDFVLCSHLHYDHVGWNTRLIDGSWVPTFPNATYVFSRQEYDSASNAARTGVGSAYSRAAFGDSVLPIVEHHRALLVEDDHALDAAFPDEIRFLPLPGHSPHHCGLHLQSGSRRALLTGDAVHHPVQIACPDWVQAPCPDEAKSIASLKQVIARCIDTDTMVLPAHFRTPTAGRIVGRPEARASFSTKAERCGGR